MFVLLSVGQHVTPKKALNWTQVSKWRFASEFVGSFYEIVPSCDLKVVGISRFLGCDWVRMKITSIDPPVILKVSPSEYSDNFCCLR